MAGGLNGSWNVQEWVPSMIKSSLELGALPDSAGVSMKICHNMERFRLIILLSFDS